MAEILPQSVCDRVKLLCGVHDQRTVSAIVGISRGAIWQMKKRGWRTAGTFRPFKPRPSDFAIQSRHLCDEALAAHYRTSCRAVRRWRRELEAAR